LKITAVESLLGKKQSSDQHHMVLLLGLLLQLEEGAYYLEDMTGQVRISFAEHVATPQDAEHFLTEQAILLVEGYYHDGLFYILRLGQPLQETRAAALKHISQQLSHPLYSTHSAADQGSMILHDTNNVSFILLQDLHMDQPRVVQQFEGLLSALEAKFHNASNSSPAAVPVFILMGNFISSAVPTTPAAGVQALKSALDELLTCIGKFPFLSQQGHFVIVPSPKDSLFHQHMLPIPAFLKSMRPTATHAIPNLHYTTNPCRIRYNNNNQEMVILRYDLLHVFQQHQLRLPQDKTEKDPASSRLFKTILDQGHLLPLPSIPTYWNASHSLGLYPLPSCLVLAGNHSSTSPPHQGTYDNYWDCDVVQTVPFDASGAAGGAYTIYRPTWNETADDIPDPTPRAPEEDDPSAAAVVEFGRIG
jgi:DNA polymerase epsilon subunit 2